MLDRIDDVKVDDGTRAAQSILEASSGAKRLMRPRVRGGGTNLLLRIRCNVHNGLVILQVILNSFAIRNASDLGPKFRLFSDKNEMKVLDHLIKLWGQGQDESLCLAAEQSVLVLQKAPQSLLLGVCFNLD